GNWIDKPVKSTFELFVASRYLRARRKEAVISVITVISVVGVAAGVMALVIALAVTNGFRGTLQRNLLGAMAHINVMNRANLNGIENWEDLAGRIRKVPHVLAVAPALYEPILLAGATNSKPTLLKGVDVDIEAKITDALRHLKAGSLDRLRDPAADPPGIIVGSKLAEDTGITLGANINVLIQDGELTPMGPRPSIRRFKAAGFFESGFFEIDDAWSYASVRAVQRAFSLEDVINSLEIKVDDIDRAPEIAKEIERVAGTKYTTTTWQEQNKQLLAALQEERIVTVIVIGMIILVAALNILIVLVMMVMEKYRDIAILMSMGARRTQIRRIFMLQGVLIGVVGSAIGLTVGYTLCHFAEKYRWIRLQESVYSMSFVPFETRWTDAIWIAALAILVSFLATLYPARNATKIAPAEVLRYE
ncbi:MAG TPA: FtsX-like permease family protein, partial [Candidatus Sulfopaludibacter sp.]|nr:FtsX-like permease family protein [Candidatus Sulfopaludibacter sp.]